MQDSTELPNGEISVEEIILPLTTLTTLILETT